MSPTILILALLFHVSYQFKITSTTCVVSNFSDVEHATAVCSEILFVNLSVPAGVTLKLNLTDGAKVTFRGNTTFGFKSWYGPLVTINGTGIVMEGENGAFFDGQGQKYWDAVGTATPKPQFFTIQAFHSIFRNLVVYNSPIDVVQATNAINVTFDNWTIDNNIADKGVAEDGKNGLNTDGFDCWNSTDILIQNSKVFNQDDCVAVRNGANILVRNMLCHGSHGLSISVGFSNDSVPLNTLKNVTFQDSLMFGGLYGIHIKTHNNGGLGSISNITYRNISIIGATDYGVIIQQNYPHGQLNSNVPITNLRLVDVTGSVMSKATPVYIFCAEGACGDFEFRNVHIYGLKEDSCNYKPGDYDC